MDTHTKHYFLASYTGKGYVHFFDEEMRSLDYVYVLKSVPGNGASTLLNRVATHFQEKREPLEYVHRSSDADALDGLILKSRNMGIFQGTSPHVLEPHLPYVDGEYVDLTQACRSEDVARSKSEIHGLREQMDAGYAQFSQALAKAFSLHEKLESFYSGQLDIEAADQLAEETIQAIFKDGFTLDKESDVKDRFVEASSESENIDFVEEITKECTVRYFITGRPGSGKSVFMKKIAEAARERGYDVERYHCGFDPDSLDLILLPELGVAAFDSTPPHDHEPSRAGDEIIDTYALLQVDPDEVHAQEIADNKASSQKAGETVEAGFRQAMHAYREMADLYGQAVDAGKVKEMGKDLISDIDCRFNG